MRIQILMYRQDDPRKCTAAKLVKFGLASDVKKTFPKTILLDPFSVKTLLPADKKLANSITAVDCSWNLADNTFSKKILGIKRKLPPLFAGNPVNYAKLNKLTTMEALAAALFLLSEDAQALELINKFKWGPTFYSLNRNLLDDYSKIKSESEIEGILREYRLVE